MTTTLDRAVVDLARDACAALDAYVAARKRAAEEVGTARRTARAALPAERNAATRALTTLAMRLTREGYAEIREIAEALAGGYYEASWTLRVTAIASRWTPRPEDA